MSTKGPEGTIQGDSSKGKDAATIARAAGIGAGVGAIAGNGKDAGIGGAAGGVIGLATVLMTRGPEIQLDRGSSVEMILERELPSKARSCVSNSVEPICPGRAGTSRAPARISPTHHASLPQFAEDPARSAAPQTLPDSPAARSSSICRTLRG